MIDGTEGMDVEIEIFGRKVSPGELSLSRLTRISAEDHEKAMERVRRGRALRAEYKEKYGDDWWKFYNCDMGIGVDHSFDNAMKFVNSCIYYGSRPGVSDDAVYLCRVLETWQSRMWELYGSDYDELRYHKNADPRVIGLLLDDAMRTGKWKELPDELQPEYRRRIGLRATGKEDGPGPSS